MQISLQWWALRWAWMPWWTRRLNNLYSYMELKKKRLEKISTCTVLGAVDSCPGLWGSVQTKVITSAKLIVAPWQWGSEDIFNLRGIWTMHCPATKTCFRLDDFQSTGTQSEIVQRLSFIKKRFDCAVTHVVLARAEVHCFKGHFHDLASICSVFLQ